MTSANTPQAMARLEARVNPDIKALWQKAADLEGVACKIVEQHRTLKLSLEDSEDFVETLLNPPRPNDALVAAA
jgi:uncharacterized protein (DUF1778 family)